MKKIFALLVPFLFPLFCLGQQSDAALSTQNTTEIKQKVYAPERAYNMYQAIINSKASLMGSYTNPSWLVSIPFSKITATPTTLSGYGITNGQPLNANLTTIGGLTLTNDNILQVKSGAWASRTIAQLKTDLNLSGTNTGDQTLNGLLPAQSGQGGKVLQTDGTNVSWQAGGGTWGTIAGTISNQTDLQNSIHPIPYENRTLFPGTADHVAESWNDAAVINDRLFVVTTAWGVDFSDYSNLRSYYRWSNDGGKTYTNRVEFLAPTGDQWQISGGAVHVKANGTIQVYVYVLLNPTTPPLQTQLCLIESTSIVGDVVTWGPLQVIYEGNYASPRSTFLKVLNNGHVLLAWNRWTGPGSSPDPYDYTSAYAEYEGRVFRNTNDGTFADWDGGTVVAAPAGNAIMEPMLTQFENDADNTQGQVDLWFRMRGGFLGRASSTDETSWTAGAASTLVNGNDNITVGYDRHTNVLFAFQITQPPYPNRRGTEIRASMDRGTTWHYAQWINRVPYSGGSWFTLPLNFFEFKGNFLFNSVTSQTSAALLYDNTQIIIPKGDLLNAFQNPINKSSTVTQGVLGTWNTDLTMGQVRFNRAGTSATVRDANNVVEFSNSTGGGFTLVELTDNKTGATNGQLTFFKGESSSAPASGRIIGSILYKPAGGHSFDFRGVMNADGNTEMQLYTSLDASTPTKKATWKPNGQMVIGSGNNGDAVLSGALAQFAGGAGMQYVFMSQMAADANGIWLLGAKSRGATWFTNPNQGDLVFGIDFGAGEFGNGGASIAAYGSADNTGGNRASELLFKTTSGGTYATRLTLSGANATFSGDVAFSNAAKGIVLKDTQGTPHYWRITVTTLGVLTVTDIGTTAP